VTDQTAQQPVENVARGAIFALAAIPIGMLAFGFLGAVGVFVFIAGMVVPFVAASLYRRGSGGSLSRAGWLPVIAISLIGIVLGVFTGLVASTFVAFQAVGGDGGIFSSAFWTTVARQLRGRITAAAGTRFFAIIGLALGIVGIFAALRTPKTAVVPAPAAVDAAAPAPEAATPAQPSPPAPNQPLPGVMLNGKPLDPKQK
jgi:hypothetical protein